MDDNERAVLNWISSFGLEETVDSFMDLTDGHMLSVMLSKMSKEHFEVIPKPPNNGVSEWGVRASNVEKILLALREYYMHVLQTDLDIGGIDIKEIVKEENPDELLLLVELLLGVAVQCSNKAAFIKRIFSLDLISQTVLKSMVENVLSGNHPCISGRDNKYANQEEVNESLLRSQEMVRHLQNERQRLIDSVNALSANNTELNEANTQLKSKLSEYESDYDVNGNQGGGGAPGQSRQYELDQVKQDMDLKNIEIEELRSEIYSLNLRLRFEILNDNASYNSSTKEAQLKAEAVALSLTDEVDVARDKAARLLKAESTIEKYQKRLEEFASLKKTNKELEDKIDEYLDRINELEDSNKNITTANKLSEQYKDKALQEEREKFDALAALQMKEAEVAQLTAELRKAMESRRQMELELADARMQLDQLSEDEDGPDSVDANSVIKLKERIKRLEYELRLAKAGARTDSIISSGDDAAIRAEMESLAKAKREKEEALLAAKKQLTDAQYEISKLKAQLDGFDANNASTADLDRANTTLKLMEAQLRERSDAIDKLEMEKTKMETHTKRALAAFKEKYIGIIEGLAQERKDLEDKLMLLSTRTDRNKETHRREEKLIMSAVYTIGLRNLEKNIAKSQNLPAIKEEDE